MRDRKIPVKDLKKVQRILSIALIILSTIMLYSAHTSFEILDVRHSQDYKSGWELTDFSGVGFSPIELPTKTDGYFRIHIWATRGSHDVRVYISDCLEQVFVDDKLILDIPPNLKECRVNPWGEIISFNVTEDGEHIISAMTKDTNKIMLFNLQNEAGAAHWGLLLMIGVISFIHTTKHSKLLEFGIQRGMLFRIVALFIFSRIALEFIGVWTRRVLDRGPEMAGSIWLNIWGVWDSGWYLDIARYGYSTQFIDRFGFLPLYPAITRAFEPLLTNLFISGLFISNIAFLASCILLYKLIRIDDDEKTSFLAVKYLILFPSSFVMSGVFSEGVFLMTILGAMLYAKRDRWMMSGLFGFFCALTKSNGILILLPLGLIYVRQKGFGKKLISKDILFILLVSAGLLSFMVYSYQVTGDLFAYKTAKELGWKYSLTNPLENVRMMLSGDDNARHFNGLFLIACIVFLAFGVGRVDMSYILCAAVFLISPLFFGAAVTNSITRFAAVGFAIPLVLARFAKKQWVDENLTISLALLQAFLFVFWSTSYPLMI